MDSENNGIQVPTSLNKEFFKSALENGLNSKNVSINKLSFSMGSGGGDNYCSQIFRIAINYSIDGKNNENISLIVKYMPMDGSKATLENLQVYERECEMYFDIVPEMQKLFKNKIMFAPKCFYAVDSPVRTMVFQDLKELGCELGDRTQGLDEEHSNLVLKKIGKFHAASVVLIKQRPEITKSFSRSIFHGILSEMRETVFLGNIRFIQKLLSTWPNFESMVGKLKFVEENFDEKALKSVTLQEGGIAVLNHGDLWINNFLFKKVHGKPVDVVFVDLQIAYYGSLGIDLNYFLNNSVQIDVLKSKRYELLRTYYSSLKETLEEFKYTPIPSWDQIRKEVQATEFYGFVSFEAVLPLISVDRETTKDNSFDSLMDENILENQRQKVFKTERMLQTLKYSLDRFDELGVLD